MRPPVRIIQNHWKDFVETVMKNWDEKKDTAQIAEITFESEAAVTRALHIGRALRRVKGDVGS